MIFATLFLLFIYYLVWATLLIEAWNHLQPVQNSSSSLKASTPDSAGLNQLMVLSHHNHKASGAHRHCFRPASLT